MSASQPWITETHYRQPAKVDTTEQPWEFGLWANLDRLRVLLGMDTYVSRAEVVRKARESIEAYINAPAPPAPFDPEAPVAISLRAMVESVREVYRVSGRMIDRLIVRHRDWIETLGTLPYVRKPGQEEIGMFNGYPLYFNDAVLPGKFILVQR